MDTIITMMKGLLTSIVADQDLLVKKFHDSFQVPGYFEPVCWAEANFEDGYESDSSFIWFVSCHLKIGMSYNKCDTSNLHISDFYRLDTPSEPPRGFATACLKECIRIASKFIGARQVTLLASGNLKSDEHLKVQIEEELIASDLDTIFAVAMQIPDFNSHISSSEKFDSSNYIDLAISFITQVYLNRRLEDYYAKLGFRSTQPGCFGLSSLMEMDL